MGAIIEEYSDTEFGTFLKSKLGVQTIKEAETKNSELQEQREIKGHN